MRARQNAASRKANVERRLAGLAAAYPIGVPVAPKAGAGSHR